MLQLNCKLLTQIGKRNENRARASKSGADTARLERHRTLSRLASLSILCVDIAALLLPSLAAACGMSLCFSQPVLLLHVIIHRIEIGLVRW